MRLAEEELGRNGLASVGVIGVRLVLVAAVLQAAAPTRVGVGDTVEGPEVGAVPDLDVARAIAAGLQDVGGLVRGHCGVVLRLAGKAAAKGGDEFGKGEFEGSGHVCLRLG